MKRFAMFLDWKNQYCENDYTTKCNLQIQCNPYQITNGIFHITRTKNFTIHAAAAAAKSLQSCPTLCDPIVGSPAGSSAPGILQARILEWVAIFFSSACMHAKSLQSCPALCDPIDGSPPGSSVHRIL